MFFFATLVCSSHKVGYFVMTLFTKVSQFIKLAPCHGNRQHHTTVTRDISSLTCRFVHEVDLFNSVLTVEVSVMSVLCVTNSVCVLACMCVTNVVATSESDDF